MTSRVYDSSPTASRSLKAAKLLRGSLIIVENAYVVLLCGFLVTRLILRNVWWVALLNNFTPLYFLPVILLLPAAVVTGRLYETVRLSLVLAVALVWFAPYFFPKSIAVPTSALLRVATLNADVANPDINRVRDWLRTAPLDVVFVQETPESWRQNDISKQVADLYPYTVANTENLDDDGKVFLSRFPVVDSVDFKLTDYDRFFQQRFVVETPFGQVVMYNIHLMPNLGDRPRYVVHPYNMFVNIALSYNENIRKVQIETLLRQLSDEQQPYIVAGDFNTSNFSYMYGELAGVMQDSFREAGVGFGMSWPATGTAAFLPPFLRIDYIWHSRGLATVSSQVGAAVGSDHFPVISTFSKQSG